MTIEITDETRYEAIDAGMAAIGYQRNPDVPRGEGATHVAEEAIAVAIDHLLPIIEQAVIDELGLVEEYEYHTRRHRYTTPWEAD